MLKFQMPCTSASWVYVSGDAAALIEKEEPGNGVACKDGGVRNREAIHREVAYLVSGFLTEAILGR